MRVKKRFVPDIQLSKSENLCTQGAGEKLKDDVKIFSQPRAGKAGPTLRSPSEAGYGAERDRTADPLLAKQVLSQLSYSPGSSNSEPPTHSSREYQRFL